MAARQGPISMAGHQICLQVWLSSSLLADAQASAGQVIAYKIKRKICFSKNSVFLNK